MICHAVCGESNNGNDGTIHEKCHNGVYRTHGNACFSFVVNELFVHAIIAAMLVFRFGKRFDYADTLCILANNAYHAVNGILHLGIERDTVFGNEENGNENEGENGDDVCHQNVRDVQ